MGFMPQSCLSILSLPCLLLAAPGPQDSGLEPGLLGEYFKRNAKASDQVPAKLKPFFVRIDKQINFSPADGDFYGSKLTDAFLVRWTGVLRANTAGSYQFATNSDDGSRLYIDDKPIVDNWGSHSMRKKTGKVTLAAGDHEIEVTFANFGGGAGCIVTWTPPGKKESTLPASALFHRTDQAKKRMAAWDQKKWKKAKNKKKKGGVAYSPRMGPWVGTALQLGKDDHGPNIAYRAIIIPLDEQADAGIVFDADTLRMAGGWLDGGLALGGLPFTSGHGQFPSFNGETLFSLHATPGWANPVGHRKDPRSGDYPPLGHLPKKWAHYKGLYLQGDRVVLAYTVGKAQVLETPTLETSGSHRAVVRSFRIQRDGSKMTLVVMDLPEGADKVTPKGHQVTIGHGQDSSVSVQARQLPQGSEFHVADGQLLLTLGAARGSDEFSLAISRETGAGINGSTARNYPETPVDFGKLTKGGPARWPNIVTTKGVMASEKDAASKSYVVDRITVPFGNEYEPRMRIGGMDFFADGKTAAVSTWDGDVWIVSGIDDELGEIEWKRFAAGLHEPLGLKIVDDVVYTVSDMQITRFHDYDNDGEADFYENFNNDWDLTSGFHAFCFDLHTDPAGRFYFAFGAPVRGGGRSFERMGEHHGSIIRVSKDGSRLERYATGLRAPNGICVGPDGQVTSGDNEGTFVPRCPIHWIDEGEFLGVVDSASTPIRKKLKTTATVSQRVPAGMKRTLDATEMPKPLAWLPKNIDNSGGGQVWVTSDRWGPFDGELLHMSYGRSSLYLVLRESKGGLMQGGTVKIPVTFTSSAMRARFNHRDGQLYVAGLRGWQSNAAKEGGFDRVRYTGKPVFMPSSLRAKKNGLEIGFTRKLDAELANDPESFTIKAANIRWTHDYGSGDYPIDGSAKKGWSTLEVTSAKLLPDGKTVHIEITGIRPAHQMEIRYDLEAEDGAALRGQINNTIHVID